MILYEEGAAPFVRGGEFDLGGRRVSVRAFAYAGEVGPSSHRFDPLDRAFVARAAAGALAAGPPDPASWSAAFAKAPPGPALVQGGSEGEPVRGSYLAAAQGAVASGRGVYLLDPPAAGMPRRSGSGRPSQPPEVVALHPWSPAGGPDPRRFEEAARMGIPAGVVWPVIPGWTAGAEFVLPFLEGAAKAGAQFAVPIAPSPDAEFRRGAVAARSASGPEESEALFDRLYHTPWEETLADALRLAKSAAERAGLASLPPRPASAFEPRANARAAGRLEEMARDAEDEHRASLLHAAVRWIDACGRDLSAILREGNFAKAFPYGRDLARETEDALREALA